MSFLIPIAFPVVFTHGKIFFIFAAVRRQAGEDRIGGAVRPATACAACGVHAAGHRNGCTGAIPAVVPADCGFL